MKQAIVLIHGIGEQKPMDTVRGFVESILPPAADGQEQYWSKPDPMSELFELRRLQAVGRNKIHFFEYYWAYQVEGTTFRHLLQWLMDLLFRWPRNVPPGLNRIWWLSWSLLAGALVLAGGGWLAELMKSQGTHSPYTPLSLAMAGLLAVCQGFLLYYAGDAARYLSPAPANIALRQRIRAEGVSLLRKLHQSGEYDRIVVVGHSLGSVIGYDILNALWREYHSSYDFQSMGGKLDELLAANRRPQPVLRDALTTLGEILRHASTNSGESTAESQAILRRAYRQAQFACWKEQRYWGNPWRVSDFITLGSPLAHGMLLMARSREEFAARKRQRELPTSPPVKDNKRYAYELEPPIPTPAGRRFLPLVLHHAAWSGVTRWTNLYFPAFWGLWGDLVGGPLAGAFGPGIDDVPVRSSSLLRYTPAAHTTYWSKVSEVPTSAAKSVPGYALPALRNALRLDYREYRVPDDAADDGFRDELTGLSARLDKLSASTPADTAFLKGLLAERFQFLHAGSAELSGQPDESLGTILEQAATGPNVASRKTAVTSLGRAFLVSTEIEDAAKSQSATRQVRLFTKKEGQWLLEFWYCYAPAA